MKRILNLLAAGVLLLAVLSPLAAGGQQEAAAAADQDIKIGFLVKLAECSWFQDEWKFAQQAADEYGFELVKISTPDGESVLSAIDNMAAQNVQGFIICTPDVKLGPSIKMKADQNNMKLMSVDDRFVGADGKPMEDVHHMGISAYEIGRQVGKALMEEAQKRGWDLSKTGADCLTYNELPTSKERTDGATDMLVEMGFPKENVFEAPTATDSTTEGGFDATNILVAAHPEVENWLVYSLCDDTTIGGVRALEGNGFKADNIIAVGINGNDLAVAELDKDNSGFHATVLLAAKQHGYETSVNMYKWIAEGIEPEKAIFTSGVLMTRDNYKQVRKEMGLE
ncbi:MAG: arabinose ABC transporter substrate-binding protein [Sediminispirochaetaceae bacterium]